jgi:hypothetical protein
MADDVTTWREVSIALKAINDRLDLMTKVFGGTVAIGAACLAYLFYTTTTTSTGMARIEGVLSGYGQRFDGIDKRLEGIDRTLEELVAAMRAPKQQGELGAPRPGFPTPTAFEGWVGVPVDDPKTSPVVDFKTPAPPRGKLWIYSQDDYWVKGIQK